MTEATSISAPASTKRRRKSKLVACNGKNPVGAVYHRPQSRNYDITGGHRTCERIGYDVERGSIPSCEEGRARRSRRWNATEIRRDRGGQKPLLQQQF